MSRKISDEKIWEGYRKILNGESLTKIAKEEGIDRGTLKKYIEELVVPNLSEEEKNELEGIMNKNFRGNSSGEGRKNRNKKARNLQSEEYKIARQSIQEYGLTDDEVEGLYQILAMRKNTKYAQDTYVIKLVELIKYFTEKGMNAQQVVDMISRRPQIFSSDLENTIKPIIEAIELRNKANGKFEKNAAYEVFEHPGIITKEKVVRNKNIEDGSDKDGGIFTDDAEVPGDEK